MEGTAVVISPLIALMKNQVDALRNFVGKTEAVHFLNSSLSRVTAQTVRQDVLEGTTKLLYVAPESLGRKENVEFLRQIKISFYAIDEAHCISEWGHDFRPEYRRIRDVINGLKTAPIMALTATATPKVQHDIQRNLDILEARVFKSSFNRPNLYYEVRPKRDIDREIIRYIKQHSGKSGIIYCLSRKKVEELAQTLTLNGIKALPYHAGLEAEVRSSHQDKFLMEEADIIVATIAFGMGIDKPDVRFVIHYDMPKSLEGYYQETGRAGRDNGVGQCISFYSSKDIKKLEQLLQGHSQNEIEIGKHLLQEVESYATSAMCRRKILLHYFGEDYEQEKCDNCDNCLHPKEQIEGQDYVTLVLQTIKALNEKFSLDHIIDVLRGNATEIVRAYQHDDLEVFGQGEEQRTHFWRSVIQQCYVHQFLEKDAEKIDVLMLTKKGEDFLVNPHSVSFAINMFNTEEEDNSTEPSPEMSSSNDELFAMLKNLLRDISYKLNMAPYLIFSENSLYDMVIRMPITIEELQACQGVGVGKAKKFGKPFVELIHKYVQDNEIEHSVDVVVKSIVNKSTHKVFIIQSIDKKIDIKEIANAQKITFDELLTEMETIVRSGTKLNINYYVAEHVDEDKQDSIMDYFTNEAQSDSVEQAIIDLESYDCTAEEIRLVRLKFLSEHAM